MREQFSHELKLDRSSYHLDSLDAKVVEWRERHPYEYVVELDRKRDYQRVKIKLIEPPPDEFRLIIGDCLHNLRSALDNVVYELALAHIGINPFPEDRARLLEFPIFGNRAMKAWECRNKIGCIPPDAQAIIKGLQPHNRGDEFASDPLWKLHELNNMDKHRAPHITLLAVSTVADFPDAPHLPGELSINFGPFEDGAQIATYSPHTSAFAEGFDPNVHMDPLLTFGIAFGQRSATPGWDCGLTLGWIRDHIRDNVLPPLAHGLPPLPLS
jgi:hypothetical protein